MIRTKAHYNQVKFCDRLDDVLTATLVDTLAGIGKSRTPGSGAEAAASMEKKVYAAIGKIIAKDKALAVESLTHFFVQHQLGKFTKASEAALMMHALKGEKPATFGTALKSLFTEAAEERDEHRAEQLARIKG